VSLAEFVGIEMITITYLGPGDILYFRGTGKASGLDPVSFDLGRNIALFRQRQIPFNMISACPVTVLQPEILTLMID
jgi:hypothetical protein